jgi:hypothetical protein
MNEAQTFMQLPDIDYEVYHVQRWVGRARSTVGAERMKPLGGFLEEVTVTCQ